MSSFIPPVLFHGTVEPLHLAAFPYLTAQVPDHETSKPIGPAIYLTPRFRMAEIYGLKGNSDRRIKPTSIGHYQHPDGSIIDTAIYLECPSPDLAGGWIYEFQTRDLRDVSEMINNGKSSGEYITPHAIDLRSATPIKGRGLYQQMNECNLQVLYLGPGRDREKDYCAALEPVQKGGQSMKLIMASLLKKEILRSLNKDMGLPYLTFDADSPVCITPPGLPSNNGSLTPRRALFEKHM